MKCWKLLCFFIIIYVGLIIYVFPTRSIESDEGTHLLLGLFYHDLFNFALNNGFSNVYEFAIDYLVHYPKLSVYYPPLYHILIALFYNFTVSENIGRVISLVFSVGSIVLVYKLGSFLYNQRVGLISAIFLGSLPIIVYISKSIYIDMFLFFFFLLSFYLGLIAFKRKKWVYYILLGVTLAFAFFTKWPAILSMPILFFYLLIQRRIKVSQKIYIVKKLVFSFFIFLLIILPYLYLSYKFGLLKMGLSATVIREAIIFPQWTTIEGWLYYPKLLPIQMSYPIAVISLFSLGWFVWKREKYYDLLIVWGLIVYLFFSFLMGKNVRYTTLYLPVLLLPLAFYIEKIIRKNKYFVIIVIFSVIFLLITSYYSLTKLVQPINETAKFIHENANGNIAFISEMNSFHTSSFMFYFEKIDRNRSKIIYRPCVFFNKSEGEINNFVVENNIEYFVFIEGNDKIETLNEIRDIDLKKQFGPAKVYVLKNFQIKPYQKCNYICLTEEKICSSFS